MRLTMYTDFSLRVLIYLGAKEPGKYRRFRKSQYVQYLEKSFDESSA